MNYRLPLFQAASRNCLLLNWWFSFYGLQILWLIVKKTIFGMPGQYKRESQQQAIASVSNMYHGTIFFHPFCSTVHSTL